MAAHGLPRRIGGIDFIVRVSPGNAVQLAAVLREFEFGGFGLSEEDFLERGPVIEPGGAANRIDLLAAIDGVESESAWKDRVIGNRLGEIPS